MYDAGTLIHADIFSDNLDPPTPRANPFTSDVDGYLAFYAANGRYDVRLSGAGAGIPTPYTWGDILLADNGVIGLSASEVGLGGSRESGPFPTVTPETFSLINFPPNGVLLPAEAKFPVGATVNCVIACQVPTGATAVFTLVDAADNVLATSAPFNDDSQMALQTIAVPLQPTDLQVYGKLTVTNGVELPGTLVIAKLVFVPAA